MAGPARRPDRESRGEGPDRRQTEPDVLPGRSPTTAADDEQDLEPHGHPELGGEDGVADVPEHRHPTAVQVDRHPADDGDEERHDEGPRSAPEDAHRRVGGREAGQEDHAQEVEVAAEDGPGRVHGHAPRAEEDDEDGEGGGEHRALAQRDAEPQPVPGPHGDEDPGDDEAEVAPGARGLTHPSRPGRLAEPVAAAHVRSEPAVTGRREDERQRAERHRRGEDHRAPVPRVVPQVLHRHTSAHPARRRHRVGGASHAASPSAAPRGAASVEGTRSSTSEGVLP